MGVTIVEFIRHDGKPPERADRGTLPSPAAMTLGLLRDQYLSTYSTSLEECTLDGIRLHFKHLASALGERFPIRSLKLSDLQGYVEQRAKARGHCGRNLSPATIRPFADDRSLRRDDAGQDRGGQAVRSYRAGGRAALRADHLR